MASVTQTKNLSIILEYSSLPLFRSLTKPSKFLPAALPHVHSLSWSLQPTVNPSPVQLWHWKQRGLSQIQITNHSDMKKFTASVLFLLGCIPFLGQGPVSKALLWAVRCAHPAFSRGCTLYVPSEPKHCSSSHSPHLSRP